MLNSMSAIARHLLRLLAYGSVGALLVLVVVFVVYLEGRTDLDLWHRADLDQEFTADSGLTGFEEYLELGLLATTGSTGSNAAAWRIRSAGPPTGTAATK